MIDKAQLLSLLRSTRTKRYCLRTAIVVGVIGILGFFVLPPIVKSVLLDKLGEALHRTVAVDSVSINPYALTVTLEGVSIKDRESKENFASFDTLYLNLQSSSIFRGGVVVGEIRLVNPKLRIVRLADKLYNFSDLLDEFMAKPKSNDPAPLFSLNNIQLTGGSVEFDDRPVDEKHLVSDINLSLPFVSNMSYAVESFVEPAFSAKINGADLHLKGKSKPFADSLESEVNLDVADIRLAKYMDYLPFDLPIRVKSGSLDSVLKLTFRQEKDKPASLVLSGSAGLRDFDVRELSDAPLLAFKQVNVEVESADLLARKFVLGRVKIDSPALNPRINRQGMFNLMSVLPREKPGQKPAVQETSGNEPPSAPLEWSLGEFILTGGIVHLLDESRGETVKSDIEAMDIRLGKIDSKGDVPAELSTQMKINRKGLVAVTGNVALIPFKADLNVDAKSLELLPFQPYFTEMLNIAVTKGLLTMNGALQLRQVEAKKPGEKAGFSGGFTGQTTVGDFLAVDKINSADFLRWKSFYLGNMDVRFGPESVSIGEVALSDFFARIIVSPQGKLNLLEIVRQPEAKADGATESKVEAKTEPSAPVAKSSEGKATVPLATADKPVLPVKIGKITLQGGNVRFTDNFVKPNYTANLRQIGGRVSGLSSEPGTVANLELRGSYDNVAPLNLSAKINPLSAKPYLDLQADIKGIEMTSFSSYSGKYAGYAIEKGKLSLFVKYKIENDQLEAENRIFLDQLTFGDAIESPDATKLPVRLAVSLLKNRKGEIDLELPISGSLNDPQFSVGGLVVKVIVNLLVKAVTSPFALIGSMFGSGEEMSNIEFDYGRAAITPASEKRLENLSKALIDRPELKLEIEGWFEPEQDREGLKQARIDRKVRALKREELTKKNIESGSVDTLEITPQEYPELLERVYKAEKFPKPRNMIGLVKSLPVEEMEKLMLTHSTVNEADLVELGDRRAKAARDWLVAHEVPVERIFLIPSKPGEANAKTDTEQKGKKSRANFSLK